MSDSNSEINKNIRVLVVDDISDVRDLLRFVLRRIGINRVDVAKDGTAAQVRLKKKNMTSFYWTGTCQI